MARAALTTTLNFGLVSAPVAVKNCTGKSGTDVHEATVDGHRAGNVKADKELIEQVVGGALAEGKTPDPAAVGEAVLKVPFESGDKGGFVQRPRKGIFGADGGFTEVPTDLLKLIDDECKLTDLTIEGFIPVSAVPFERAIGAYFLTPPAKAVASAKPLALLRDGMTAKNVAGFGRLTLRTKTYVFVVHVRNGGLILNTLEYAAKFSQAEEAAASLAGVATDEKTVTMAGTLIDQLTVDAVNLDGIVDDRFEKREELYAKVLAGEKIEATEKPETEETVGVDLAELLAASIGANAPAAAKTSKKVATAA